MAEKSRAEQTREMIQDLKDNLEEFQTSVRLADIRDSVEDLGSSVKGLGRRIIDLREKGYAFEKELETTAADLERDWAGIAPELESQIEKEAAALIRSLRPLETQIHSLEGESRYTSKLAAQVERLQSQTEGLENRVEAADETIRGMYDQFSSEVQTLKSHLYRLEWMLTELSEATFELLATESGIMAVKAVWAKGKEQKKTDPEGVLFLTDQRLLFEQKEKVATKKVLFIATEKEKIQELLWEVPVALIEDVRSHREGFMGNQSYIEVQFGGGAVLNKANLRIWQPGDEWVSLLNRAKAGDFDQTRAVPIDEEIAERAANAPTQCPECGGAINQVVMRGMDSLTCEYCGSVIRL